MVLPGVCGCSLVGLGETGVDLSELTKPDITEVLSFQ